MHSSNRTVPPTLFYVNQYIVLKSVWKGGHALFSEQHVKKWVAHGAVYYLGEWNKQRWGTLWKNSRISKDENERRESGREKREGGR